MVLGVLLMIVSIIELIGGAAALLITLNPAAVGAIISGGLGLWVSLIMKHTFERLDVLEKDMDKLYRTVENSYSDIVTHAYEMQSRVIDEQSRELRSVRRKKSPARIATSGESDDEDDERIK